MYKLSLRDMIDKYFYCILYIVIIVFSFFLGQFLKTAQLYEINIFEYIIINMSDSYYLVYFMLVILIYFIFINLKTPNEMLLIRGKGLLSYFIQKNISNFIFCIFFISFHVIIIIIVGSTKLSISTQFSSYSNDLRIISIYKDIFNSPIQTTFYIWIYMILGCFFITFLMEFVNLLSNKYVSIIITILLYLLTILVISGAIENNDFALNNYFILHNVILNNNFFNILLIQIAVIVLSIIYIKNMDFIKFKKKHFKKNKNIFLKHLINKKNMFIVILVVFVYNLLLVISIDNGTILDSVVVNLLGYKFDCFSYIEFIKVIIYNGLPLYILCVFYQDENKSRDSKILIRAQNKWTWFKQIQIAIIIFIIIYVLLHIIFNILLSFVFLDRQFIPCYIEPLLGVYNYDLNNYLYLIISSIALRVFELITLQLIFFVILSNIKSITLSFYISIGLYFFSIFNDNIMKFTPYGISFIYRILILDNELYKSINTAFVILIITYMLNIIFLKLRKFKNLL